VGNGATREKRVRRAHACCIGTLGTPRGPSPRRCAATISRRERVLSPRQLLEANKHSES